MAVEHVVKLQEPSAEQDHIILQNMVEYVKPPWLLLMAGMLIKDFVIIAQQDVCLLQLLPQSL